MPSVYRSPAAQLAIRQWCSDALASADFPLTSSTLPTRAGQVELTSAGTGQVQVVLVPGTGFNAAVALAWLKALSARWPTTVVDLPGQPGLSDPYRPRRHRLAWYGQLLAEILAAVDADRVVVLGNSLGAAVTLAADSPRIAARVLVAPAGFIRLSMDPGLVLASARWLARPTSASTRQMLRSFVAPGGQLPETEVEWMTLVARCCRTTLAPPPLAAELLRSRTAQPMVVAVGEHDRFLPPRRLVPAVRRTMNLDVRVLPGAGHLTVPTGLDEVASLVAEVIDPGSAGPR